MADQELDETLLTHGSTSPFLPDTFIQYDRVREKVEWLIANAIPDGECLICTFIVTGKQIGRAHV